MPEGRDFLAVISGTAMGPLLSSDFGLSPATWFYLSAVLGIAIYFKFRRFWSVRNLDLALLFLLVPGLLIVEMTPGPNRWGLVWLVLATLAWLVRLLIDPVFERRPVLEPNLNLYGLAFLGAGLLCLLVGELMTRPVSRGETDHVQRTEQILRHHPPPSLEDPPPGFPVLQFAELPTVALGRRVSPRVSEAGRTELIASRSLAIVAQLALVAALVLIGWHHFESLLTGVAIAALYLLLPVALLTGQELTHVLPAALVIWAVYAFRRPALAGGLLASASAVIYFPGRLLPLWREGYLAARSGMWTTLLLHLPALFCAMMMLSMPLVPLWVSFYWGRSAARFLVGFVGVLGILTTATVVLAVVRPDAEAVADDSGVEGADAGRDDAAVQAEGFWSEETLRPYRVPVIIAFAGLCAALAAWPPQKHLGHLIALSAAVLAATQFWYFKGGGTYLLWYLPLVLLTIFRPNLADQRPPAVPAFAGPFGWRRRPVNRDLGGSRPAP